MENRLFHSRNYSSYFHSPFAHEKNISSYSIHDLCYKISLLVIIFTNMPQVNLSSGLSSVASSTFPPDDT